mgnify:CR=1 FL=1
MTHRDVVIEALSFRTPPYVPWAWGPTKQSAERLIDHLGLDGLDDLDAVIDSHFLDFGAAVARTKPIDENRVRDAYGVIWDRTVDKDIGTPSEWPIKRPEDLDTYSWPDPNTPDWYAHIEERLRDNPDRFSRYCLGFSLYERAWTMRGMTELLMDMVERPEFVERFMDQIVEHNLVQVRKALAFGVDAVYFGDDYGMQRGLIMGIDHWRHFIKPRLARMFEPVRAAGKFVCMHSCGKVDELFDDLVEIGLNVFNPFQPEVMDVYELLPKYHGRLAFHGGMSVQKILPFGSVEDVRAETRKLIEAGQNGGYVFSPSHGVPSDVPPENLVAMMEELKGQRGRS